MEEIKAGDVVQLKAQTQSLCKITVGEIIDGEAECVWFDAGYHLHKDLIRVAALKVVEQQ